LAKNESRTLFSVTTGKNYFVAHRII